MSGEGDGNGQEHGEEGGQGVNAGGQNQVSQSSTHGQPACLPVHVSFHPSIHFSFPRIRPRKIKRDPWFDGSSAAASIRIRVPPRHHIRVQPGTRGRPPSAHIHRCLRVHPPATPSESTASTPSESTASTPSESTSPHRCLACPRVYSSIRTALPRHPRALRSSASTMSVLSGPKPPARTRGSAQTLPRSRTVSHSFAPCAGRRRVTRARRAAAV